MIRTAIIRSPTVLGRGHELRVTRSCGRYRTRATVYESIGNFFSRSGRSSSESGEDRFSFAPEIPETDDHLRPRVLDAIGGWGAVASHVLEARGARLDELGRMYGVERYS